MVTRCQCVGALALLLAFSPVRHAAGQAHAPRAAFGDKLAPCRVAGLDEDVLCGRREVFENRATATGRTIALNVVVLPATTDSVLGDPLFFLAGGGVVPATRYARFLGTAMPALRRHRDIVLVDQRGTGGSNALACDRARLDTLVGLPSDLRYLAYVAACRASLADRADVRFYTTSLAMEDLDDVREWLGFRTINLYAASYGTSAAATYIRRHPARVRAVVMHGVVPLDVPMQVDLARSAQESLDRVFGLCAADAACAASYPDLREDFARVLARLDSIAASDPAGQRRIVGQSFRDAVNTALGALPGIRTVPRLVHAAALAIPPSGGGPPPGPEPAPLGVRLALLCSEGLAGIDTATIARATARTFLGEFPVRFQLRWCEGWPTLPLPSDFRAPLRSSVPALLLTGELDPITPPRYAEHVKEWFTNGTTLRLPYRSHSDTDPCVTGIIEVFIVSGGRLPDSSCLGATPKVQFERPGD
jgi:pimeloyl-ACP methyl ester carboxylesterase